MEAVAAWAFFRQVEALRESVASVLEKGAVGQEVATSFEKYHKWISDQGVEPTVCNVLHQDGNVTKEVYTKHSMRDFVEERCSYGRSLTGLMQHSRRSGEEDFGVDRSGVGWHSLPNFVITSAFVRLLGASEQFELDALKALLYYRPLGKTVPVEEYLEATATSDVLTETPENEKYYAKPVIWTWLKKAAENNVERRKIFKSVFDIEPSPAPASFKNLSRDAINTYQKELYEDRNKIAHGREGVEMTLSDYCNAEWFVVELARSITDQCRDKFKLIL